jgi:hypothetical protein
MADFKVRCTNGVKVFTTGKLYDVIDGKITFDGGRKSSNRYNSVDDLNTIFESQFELLPDSPRICSVIGGEENPLKIGERFSLDYECVKGQFIYFIGSNGNVCIEDNLNCLADGCLCDIINHPEKIIRQPQFSEDEKALMRLYVGKNFHFIARDIGGELYCFDSRPKKDDLIYTSDSGSMISIPKGLLAAITFENSPFNAAEYLEGLK